MKLETVVQTAMAAAYEGAAVIRSLAGKADIRKKGDIDLVTEADIGSEKAIIRTIKATFPDHAIHAEETGRGEEQSPCEWIIDPLDGTTNFAHNIGHYAVSIAFAVHRKIVMGLVLNPIKNELFAATAGSGATLNGNPISVSGTPSISESLLATGFPYNFKENFTQIQQRFTRCLMSAQGVRRFGSAALDLCDVACGRYDGYWEQNLKPWDWAAGYLIAVEAGASVKDFAGIPYGLDNTAVLATNGKIHQEMISLLEVQDQI
jgi:myo-inositol-1(or 4)-monophosphatase